MRHATLSLTVGPLLVAALLSGCGSDEPAAEPTPSTAPPVTSTSTETPTAPEGVGVGEVVEGFPTDVIPVLPDAEITLSTAVSANGVRQVSLAGNSALPPEGVLAFYRDAFVAQGFTETPSVVPSGVVGSTFTRGDATELLTVTVTTVNDAQTFTVGGQLTS